MYSSLLLYIFFHLLFIPCIYCIQINLYNVSVHLLSMEGRQTGGHSMREMHHLGVYLLTFELFKYKRKKNQVTDVC